MIRNILAWDASGERDKIWRKPRIRDLIRKSIQRYFEKKEKSYAELTNFREKSKAEAEKLREINQAIRNKNRLRPKHAQKIEGKLMDCLSIRVDPTLRNKESAPLRRQMSPSVSLKIPQSTTQRPTESARCHVSDPLIKKYMKEKHQQALSTRKAETAAIILGEKQRIQALAAVDKASKRAFRRSELAFKRTYRKRVWEGQRTERMRLAFSLDLTSRGKTFPIVGRNMYKRARQVTKLKAESIRQFGFRPFVSPLFLLSASESSLSFHQSYDEFCES